MLLQSLSQAWTDWGGAAGASVELADFVRGVGEQYESAVAAGGARAIAGREATKRVSDFVARSGLPSNWVPAFELYAQRATGGADWCAAGFEADLRERMDDPFTSEESFSAFFVSVLPAFFKEVGSASRRHVVARRGAWAWQATTKTHHRIFSRLVGIEPETFEALEAAFVKSAPIWAKVVLAKVGGVSAAMAKILAIGAGSTAVGVSLVLVLGAFLQVAHVYRHRDVSLPIPDINFPDVASVVDAVQLDDVIALKDAAFGRLTGGRTRTRVDPTYTLIRGEVEKYANETVAGKNLAQLAIGELLDELRGDKRLKLFVPGTSDEALMVLFQKKFSDFRVIISSWSHTHSECWAVRRVFEHMVSDELLRTFYGKAVRLIGGSERQEQIIPFCVHNCAPVLTGRDAARQNRRCTAVECQKVFQECEAKKTAEIAVAFFSLQDVEKKVAIAELVKQGVRTLYVAFHAPAELLSPQLGYVDDRQLNVNFRRTDSKIHMTHAHGGVAGYTNNAVTMMSWLEPIKPFSNISVTMDCMASHGSAHLVRFDIGGGLQEEYPFTWVPPRFAYYELPRVTPTTAKIDGDNSTFIIDADKFDSLVKFGMVCEEKSFMAAIGGRAMGLTSEVKISGSVLERSWFLDHREFTAVVTHAAICATLNKVTSSKTLEQGLNEVNKSLISDIIQFCMSGYKNFFFGSKSIGAIPATGVMPDLSWLQKTTDLYQKRERFCFVQKPGGKPRLTIVDAGEDDGALLIKRLDEPEMPTRPGGRKPDEEAMQERDERSKEKANERRSVAEGKRPATEMSPEFQYKVGGASEERRREKKSEVADFESEARNDGVKIRPAVAESSGTRKKAFTFDRTGVRTQVLVAKEPARFITDGKLEPDAPYDNNRRDVDSIAMKESQGMYESFSALLKAARKGEVLLPDRGGVDLLQALMDDEHRTFVAQDHEMWVSPARKAFELVGDDPLSTHVREYWRSIDDIDQTVRARRPQFVLDGLASSAKSSVFRAIIGSGRGANTVRALAVCPSRKLADDYVEAFARTRHRVVTRHSVTAKAMQGMDLMVIDECYGYEMEELLALCLLAGSTGMKVVCLGDRYQQYEDIPAVKPEFFKGLTRPMLRMMVMNTVSPAATAVLHSFATQDPFRHCIQTRSAIDGTIEFLEDSHITSENIEDLKGDLAFKTTVESEMASNVSEKDVWGDSKVMSISRVQGSREKHCLWLTSGKESNWLVSQMGLFYVAITRHTVGLLIGDTGGPIRNALVGTGVVEVRDFVGVNGRLTMLADRDHGMIECKVLKAIPRTQRCTEFFSRRGYQQGLQIVSFGGKIDDSRPTGGLVVVDANVSDLLLSANEMQGPARFNETLGPETKVMAGGRGLLKINPQMSWQMYERPEMLMARNSVASLGLWQSSSDRIAMLKTLMERPGRAKPDYADADPLLRDRQAEVLFQDVKKFLFDPTKPFVPYEEPRSTEWLERRTTSFLGSFNKSAIFTTIKKTLIRPFFQKQQVKVIKDEGDLYKSKYGQTVIASEPDINSIICPHMMAFQGNILARLRPEIIIDIGMSNADLASRLRRNGAAAKLEEAPKQMDIAKQDTEHEKISLEVVVKLMREAGVREDIVGLYKELAKSYTIRALNERFVEMLVTGNLASGDQITLLRNILQAITKVVATYAYDPKSIWIFKGDDILTNDALVKREDLMPIPEIDNIGVTHENNGVAYHAGRFLINGHLYPDPFRMIVRLFSYRGETFERVTEVIQSIHDRYYPVQAMDYDYLLTAMIVQYPTIKQETLRQSLGIYVRIKERSYLHSLLTGEDAIDVNVLTTYSPRQNCVSNCVRAMGRADYQDFEYLNGQSMGLVSDRLKMAGIPVEILRGSKYDFSRKAVWLSPGHAFLVIGLTEFNEIRNGNYNHQDVRDQQADSIDGLLPQLGDQVSSASGSMEGGVYECEAHQGRVHGESADPIGWEEADRRLREVRDHPIGQEHRIESGAELRERTWDSVHIVDWFGLAWDVHDVWRGARAWLRGGAFRRTAAWEGPGFVFGQRWSSLRDGREASRYLHRVLQVSLRALWIRVTLGRGAYLDMTPGWRVASALWF